MRVPPPHQHAPAPLKPATRPFSDAHPSFSSVMAVARERRQSKALGFEEPGLLGVHGPMGAGGSCIGSAGRETERPPTVAIALKTAAAQVSPAGEQDLLARGAAKAPPAPRSLANRPVSATLEAHPVTASGATASASVLQELGTRLELALEAEVTGVAGGAPTSAQDPRAWNRYPRVILQEGREGLNITAWVSAGLNDAAGARLRTKATQMAAALGLSIGDITVNGNLVKGPAKGQRRG